MRTLCDSLEEPFSVVSFYLARQDFMILDLSNSFLYLPLPDRISIASFQIIVINHVNTSTLCLGKAGVGEKRACLRVKMWIAYLIIHSNQKAVRAIT